MSYEVELDGTMADIRLLVCIFEKQWLGALARNPHGTSESMLWEEIEEMLSGSYQDAVDHFDGWFGGDVDLISPELRKEREASEREAQDVIDKADFN